MVGLIAKPTYVQQAARSVRQSVPGLVLVIIATACAALLSRFLAAPAIIVALIVGLTLNPLTHARAPLRSGVSFAAEPLMKLGVACLGAGVNLSLLVTLGWPVFVTLFVAMTITVLSGLALGRMLGQSQRLSILSAGAIAICGASAALAISCALPKGDTDERDLSVVIIAVSLLSAAGIILYPLITRLLAFDDVTTGIVLGGSLHNVAQSIAAGFSVSDTAGETATLVKMSRVAMLAPLVMIVPLMMRREKPHAQINTGTARKRWAVPPAFLVGFVILMTASGLGLLPDLLKQGFMLTSKISLLMAMTAIGLRTSVIDVVQVDRRTMILLLAETAILLAVILAAVMVLPLSGH